MADHGSDEQVALNPTLGDPTSQTGRPATEPVQRTPVPELHVAWIVVPAIVDPPEFVNRTLHWLPEPEFLPMKFWVCVTIDPPFVFGSPGEMNAGPKYVTSAADATATPKMAAAPVADAISAMRRTIRFPPSPGFGRRRHEHRTEDATVLCIQADESMDRRTSARNVLGRIVTLCDRCRGLEPGARDPASYDSPHLLV